MQRRLMIVAGAAVVGAVFLAGLFIHGPLGGALLLVVVAMLLGLLRITWSHLRPQGRPLRVAVIVIIVVVAAIKLAGG
jgi:hypothetical protein